MPLDEENKPETGSLRGNEAMRKNSSKIESVPNKRHSAVAHHFTTLNVASKVCLVGWIPAVHNIEDAMAKLLPEDKHNDLFCNWVHQLLQDRPLVELMVQVG